MEEKIKDLIEQLYKIPQDFALIPVNGKNPYKQKWQEKCFSREEIQKEIARGAATGFAIALKGQKYLAIDVDGDSANEFLCLNLVENFLEFPETVQWTSNKSPNRYSFILGVSESQAQKLDEMVETVKKIPTGKKEQLELRWNKCCCVLPPSIHPGTQKPYQWKANKGNSEIVYSPDQVSIAQCSDEFLNMLLSIIPKKNEVTFAKASSSEDTELKDLLKFIPIENHEDYQSWITVLMALCNTTKGSDDGLKLADLWSSGAFSENYKSANYKGFEDVQKFWKGIDANKENGYTIKTLYWLAMKNGYQNKAHDQLKELTIDELESMIQKNNQYERESARLVTERMNREYAVIQSIGNKPVLLKLNKDSDDLEIPKFEFVSPASLSLWCQNRKAISKEADPFKENAKPEYENFYSIWIKDERRAEFESVKFAPGQTISPKVFNLFQGFTVKPVRGDISLYKNHVFEVICNSDEKVFNAVWKWLAHLFQKPGELPRVALVMTNTKQGIGKGAFLNPIGQILGKAHYREETNMERVAGKFNGHLAACLLLNANEATWGGEKPKEGALKALITDPTRSIEYKGKDAITLNNFTRLIVTSNEPWPVPVGKDDRRFIVWTPSAGKKNNAEYFHKYFDFIGQESFLQALLYEFLYEIDLTGYVISDRKNIPFSIEHLDLKLTSLQNNNVECYFWEVIVSDGTNTAETLGDNKIQYAWKQEASLDQLHEGFRLWCECQSRLRPESKDQFMRGFRKYLPETVRDSKPSLEGERKRVLTNMNLAEIRRHFVEKVLHVDYETISKKYSW